MELRFWDDPLTGNECYDNQSEDEHTAEHEAALKAKGHTVMVVPTELVPQIVQLISQKEPA